MAMVSSSDFLRAPERPNAIATLNRQRHLTPSCGGLTPTAERTVGPARISLESLTPRPGIREQNLPSRPKRLPHQIAANIYHCHSINAIDRKSERQSFRHIAPA